MENKLPIIVFDVAAPDAVYRALLGDHVGTEISSHVDEAITS